MEQEDALRMDWQLTTLQHAINRNGFLTADLGGAADEADPKVKKHCLDSLFVPYASRSTRVVAEMQFILKLFVLLIF